MKILWGCVVVVLLALMGTLPVQMQPDCPFERCLNLVNDRSLIEVVSIRAKSDLPVFTNPLLEVTFRLKTQNLPEVIGIEAGFYQLTNNDGSTPRRCNLLLTGADQNLNYVRYYQFETRLGSGNFDVYAFCRELNLPGTDGMQLAFPKSERDSSLPVENLSVLEDGNLERIIAKITASDDGCKEGTGNPLTLNSLAAQFAIFILYQPAAQRDSVWEDFLVQAKNSIYLRDRDEGIYCLLKEVDIQPPPPTSTFTPTATSTPVIPPTITPEPSPTMTFVPLSDQTYNMPIIGERASLGEFFLVLAAGVTGTILLMAGVTAIRIPPRRLLLLLIALMLIVGITGLWVIAQGADDNALPPLLLVILLDDSGTMNPGVENNSLTATGKLTNRRIPTDPGNLRSEAVISLIRQLQTDPRQTHQVAVLSFAVTGETPKWLSGNLDDTNPDYFVEVGAESDTAQIDAMIERLRTPRSYTTGPGNTVKAFQDTLLPVLRTRLENSTGNYKPVTLLITDDVPIDAFAGSPWRDVRDPWLDYVRPFEESLQTLANAPLYNGYCASPAVDNVNPTGMSWVTFALGAANWVNSDATLRTLDEVESDFAAENEYFFSLSRRLNAFRFSDPTRPLLYRIDPLFSEADAAGVREGLQHATVELLSELRCAWDVPVSASSQGLSRIDYTLDVSPLYRQLHFIADVSGGVTIPQVMAGGTPVPFTPLEAADWKNGEKRLVWSIDQSQVENWAGKWLVQFTADATTPVDLYISAEVDLSGITAEVLTETEGLRPNENTEFSFQLLKDGKPLADSTVISRITGAIEGDGTLIEFTPDNSRYTGVIPGSKTVRGGDYRLNLTLHLNQQPGVPLKESIPLPVTGSGDGKATLSYSTGFSFGIPEPASGNRWETDCLDGSQSISLPFAMGAADVQAESIGSYARVEVYYPPPDPEVEQTITATPFTVLSYDTTLPPPGQTPVSRFVGEIDCSQLLMSGSAQKVVVRAIFPGGEVKTNEILFEFNPTYTPTFTPLPPVTATPTFTPTMTHTPLPPLRTPMDDLVESVSTPLVSMGIAGLAGLVGLGGVWWVTGWAINRLLPLRLTWLETPDEGEMRHKAPVLPWWRRLNPLFQRATVSSGATRLFVVTGHQAGRVLRVEPLVELRINNEFVRPGQHVLSQRQTTSIQYHSQVFVLSNQRATLR
jgi:hypothetical protein